MPSDWDDHHGWESHYAARVAASNADPWFGVSAALRFAPFVLQREARRVWFPGCGLDGCPRVYAALGLEVWATDIASTTIQVQQRQAKTPFEALGDSIADLIHQYLPDFSTPRSGTLHALVHDFREPFGVRDLDFVLNIKSFQALQASSMRRAAAVFFAALRPGGHAFFDTQNVQGEYRNVLEDALLAAAFHLPYQRTERWYREVLAATGIPHLFILGRPIVPLGEPSYKGRAGKRKRDQDQERLHQFHAEYQQRLQHEAREMEALANDSSTRTAVVVYNTG
jgi:hypothetical protein